MTNPTLIRASVMLFLALTSLTGCRSGPPRVFIPLQPISAFKLYSTNQLTVDIHPLGNLVQKGQGFAIAATVNGHPRHQPVHYEWQWNKAPVADPAAVEATWQELKISTNGFSDVPGVTNVHTLVVTKASTNDVAYYRVKVTAGGQTAVSQPVPIWVWEETHSIIVYGTVVTTSGGASGACPGAYGQRVDIGGGYWPTSVGPYSARDLARSDTWIRWCDYYYVGRGCSSGGYAPIGVIYIVPHYFTVYIPVGGSASTPYPLYLQNFY